MWLGPYYSVPITPSGLRRVVAADAHGVCGPMSYSAFWSLQQHRWAGGQAAHLAAQVCLDQQLQAQPGLGQDSSLFGWIWRVHV
eukprot:5123838-Alexandrium_andersonii.AAC.1